MYSTYSWPVDNVLIFKTARIIDVKLSSANCECSLPWIEYE